MDDGIGPTGGRRQGRGADTGGLLAQLGRRADAAVTVAGATLTLAVVAFGVAVHAGDPVGLVLQFVIAGVPAAGVLVGGLWLRRRGVPRSRHPRIALWCYGGMAGFLGVNVGLMVLSDPATAEELLGWGLSSTVFGAAGGLGVGVVEARAITAEVAAERAERLRAEREAFAYLNSLLRHEVLNATTLIGGYADTMLERGEFDRDQLEIVAQQSQRMTEVIQDIRTLLEGTQGEGFEPVCVADVLRDQVADLRSAYDVEARVDVVDDAWVRADDLFGRILWNLLSNAVEHHDGDVPTVRATVEESDGSVTVRVADDGPGVPADDRDALFEEGHGDHGHGLYLVQVLARRYGGDVRLESTGDDGSVFAVTLPRAEPPAGAAGASDRHPGRPTTALVGAD